MVINPKFAYQHLSMDEVIELGLKKLNKIERYFTKMLNRDIGRYIKAEHNMTLKEYEVKNGHKIIDKIKFLESHKAGLTGHLHGMYWFDNDWEHIFKKVYENTIKHFGLNIEYCDNESVHNASASTYIYKYIIKDLKTSKNEINYEQDSINDSNYLKYEDFPNHYRRYFNNTRFFSSSRFRHTTQSEIDIAYSFLAKNRPELLDYYKSLEKPLYVSLEELIQKGIFNFTYDNKESITIDYSELNKLIDKALSGKIKKFRENNIYREKLKLLLSKSLFFIPYTKNIESALQDTNLKVLHTIISKNKKQLENNNHQAFGFYSDTLLKEIASSVSENNDFKELRNLITNTVLENIDSCIKQTNVKVIKNVSVVSSVLNSSRSTHLKNSFLIYSRRIKQLERSLYFIDIFDKHDLHEYTIIKTRDSMVENKVDESYFLPFMNAFENEYYEAYAYGEITHAELNNKLSA